MLTCPRCGGGRPDEERFCPDCGMPLLRAPLGVEHPAGDARARARKIRPQYSDGDLVRVAGGRNQAEAEFIQALLLEEGVPSMVRRSRGFDVPDMLAAGPRDVMVPASGAAAARDVLLQAEIVAPGALEQARPGALRLALWMLAVLAAVALIAWLGTSVLG